MSAGKATNRRWWKRPISWGRKNRSYNRPQIRPEGAFSYLPSLCVGRMSISREWIMVAYLLAAPRVLKCATRGIPVRGCIVTVGRAGRQRADRRSCWGLVHRTLVGETARWRRRRRYRRVPLLEQFHRLSSLESGTSNDHSRMPRMYGGEGCDWTGRPRFSCPLDD